MWDKSVAVLIIVCCLSFSTLGATSSSNSTVELTIISGCGTAIKSFEAPKGGKLGRNETGSFEAEIVNNGTFADTTVNASLNISYMVNNTINNSELNTSNSSINNSINSTRKESIKKHLNLSLQQNISDGYQVKRDYDNFTRKVDISSGNNTANYIKFFDAIPEYPYGRYNATLNVDFSCRIFEPSSNDTTRIIDEGQNGNDITFISETVPFNIVRASGNTEPQPVEVPNPVPDPEPQIEIEPLNRTYTTGRNQPKDIGLNIENVGSQNLTEVSIIPQIQVLEGDWERNNASINEIKTGETFNRSVIITPPSGTEPGMYTIPVVARDINGSELDTDYFYLEVEKTSFEPKFRIMEAPRSVQLTQGTNQELPILVKNIGKSEIGNLTAEVQNSNDCVEIDSPIIRSLAPNATTSINLNMKSLNVSEETCSSTLTVASQDGAFASTDLEIQVSQEDQIIPEEQQPPIIAVIWTALLVGYSLLRKRMGIDSFAVNAPLIFLVLGEVAILLYLVVGHYSLVSLPFLPF